MVIRETAKGTVTRHLDSVKTGYRNDGSAIRFHASNHEIIIYDKLKDLERGKKSDKRAIEDKSGLQLDILQQEFRKPFEVARLEVRLGNRQKLKSVLESLQLGRELTFEKLFDVALAKAVLLYYWHKVTPDMPLLATSQFRPDELYDAIHKTHPELKPAKVLQLVGALSMIRHTGMEGLRVRIEQHSASRTWYELKKVLQSLNTTTKLKYNTLQVVEKHLCDFVPLRLVDYRV